MRGVRADGTLKVVAVAGAIVAGLLMMAADTMGVFPDDLSTSQDRNSDDAFGSNQGVSNDGRHSAGGLVELGQEGRIADDGVRRDARAEGRETERCSGTQCSTPARRRGAADREALRAKFLRGVASDLARRSRSSGFSSSQGHGQDAEEPNEPEAEYANIRDYLRDGDEAPSDVRDVIDILADPSNIVNDAEHVSLLAWDRREQEPQGSYLYVLEQDMNNAVSQVHRYFCPQRRLDILAEVCVPIASVYSNSGEPYVVEYSAEGLPTELQAHDLDPSQFSREMSYTEANELLLQLQAYFNSMRV